MAAILLCCLPCSFFGVYAQPNGSSSLPTVVISEVMSKNNEYPVQTQDGPTPDWIELENFGDEWVNMGGFVINDGDTFEDGFVFPDNFAIGPLQRVLLMADGSGRFVRNNLHLDFKIKSSGEKITLFDPSGAVISSVDVPELETDQVYGLVPDVSPATAQATGDGYAILNEPTPGAPNAAAAPEKPFDVRVVEVLGPVTGSFPVEVEIIEQTKKVQGVTLTYLVNGEEQGSIPMTSSGDGRYTATIPEQSPGVMIQWFFTVTDPSGTTTRFPTFATPTSREYYGTFVDNPSLATNLPVVDLYCKDKDTPFLEGKDAAPGCSVMVNGHYYDNIIVRRRGVSSIAWPKPKFKVDAGDQGKIFQIFEDDDRTVKEFNMNSEWAEPGENSFMRETLAWKALKEMGVDALDYYQTQVRLNGEYFGKFSLGEDWDEDPLDEAGFATPGPLMKSISGEYSNLRWDLDPWQAQFYYRPIILKDEDAFRDLSDFTQGLAGAYCGSRSSYVYDHVNLPKTINYMAAMTLMLNQDRCTKNFYVYQDPKEELWTMLPWDVEAAFGTDRGLGGKPAPDYCILECEQWNSPLFCDKNHPQDLKVTTPWGLITTIIDPDRAAKRRRLANLTPGFPGMTDGTPLNGAAALGLSLPNTSSIPPNYDGDQRSLYDIPGGARGTYNFLIDAILSIPTTRAMYMRRLRTLMDEFLSTDRLKTLATEEYNLIKEEAQRDIEFWGNSGDVERGYTQIVSEQIPIRTQQLYGTYGPDGDIPLIPEAQPSDATFEIEQVTPGPNGSVKIVNPNNIALDISGWAIKGGDTFEYEFIPGTVIPANGEAYIAMNPTALRKSMASSSETNDNVQCSHAFILPDAQELLTTLNSIKPDAKVTADIAFTEDGLTVHWINKSKSLQSGIFLGKKLFEQYSLTSVVEFTVDVTTLLSVLKVFIASDVGAIHMEYPGPNREFILKSSIRQSGSSAPTQDEYLLPTAYAKIETMAYASSANLLEYFNEPSSSILGKGSIFKDAIEDVTMASKDVLVEMKDRPQQLTFSSVSPEIEVYVDVPVDSLSAFACETPIVEARYNKKYLLNAFSVSPGNTAELGPDSHLCKVAIDPEGLMKVTHMWKMMPRNIAEQQSSMGGDVHDESKQVMVVTQYVILPMIDGVDDNESEFNDMSSRAQ